MKQERSIFGRFTFTVALSAGIMSAFMSAGCTDSDHDVEDFSQPLIPILMIGDSVRTIPVATRATSVYTDQSNTLGLYLTPSRASTLYTYGYSTIVTRWVSSEARVDPGVVYDVFGYLPVTDDITSSISGYGSSFPHTGTTTNPVLTLSGLNPILTDELAVVTGVKRVESFDNPTVPTKGCFAYQAGTTTNYICLLMERIVTCYQLQIAIGNNTVATTDARYDAKNYAGVRRIKLKKMSITSSAASQMQAVVTFNDNPAGCDPAIQSVAWNTTGGTAQQTLFNNENGQELTSEYTEIAFYSMPASLENVVLTSTYDVYDHNGNLVRKDCTAVNNLTTLLSGINPKIGTKYTINLVVKPTYLYQLSDGDLDNPTITIANN